MFVFVFVFVFVFGFGFGLGTRWCLVTGVWLRPGLQDTRGAGCETCGVGRKVQGARRSVHALGRWQVRGACGGA